MSLPLWLIVPGREPRRLDPADDLLIGRGAECDLRLPSPVVSRKHAALRWESGLPFIFDLGSRNGTFRGLDRVHRSRVVSGSRFRLADVVVRVVASHNPPSGVRVPLLGGEGDPLADTQVYDNSSFGAPIYDELEWLRDALPRALHRSLRAQRGPESFARWLDRVEDLETLWELLRLGLLQPRDPDGALGSLGARELAQACRETARVHELLGGLQGERCLWDEVHHLRRSLLDTPIYVPLRHFARAYRPGRRLSSLGMKDLVYELSEIYAAGLTPPELRAELRRLLTVGFLAPTPAAGAAAWFPDDWESGAVEFAARGRAFLISLRYEAS